MYRIATIQYTLFDTGFGFVTVLPNEHISAYWYNLMITDVDKVIGQDYNT